MQENLRTHFSGQTILITGHTGFKGTWLSIWLQELGANVVGYSLAPPTDPSLFDLTCVGSKIKSIIGDIRDFAKLSETIEKHQPTTIFHLAAQPIVLHSYDLPKETFDINVGGTINLLEAARHTKSVKAIVVVTTDKVYDNKEWIWGYRENDALGFHEPYSTSKAMAELAVGSYAKTIYQGKAFLATARAGNVIGGGDFSDMRLIPDAIKALIQKEPIRVRNPNSVRPWLHVLDPLHGYLLLAQKMCSDSWNFGPQNTEAVSVQMIINKMTELWGDGDWIDVSRDKSKPEMEMLRLNWDKAASHLQWHPNYNWEEALTETVHWYKSFAAWMHHANKIDLREVCVCQIEKFSEKWEEKTCNSILHL